jgi:MerR family transcriptional regulator, thiopeptide resistance regulator
LALPWMTMAHKRMGGDARLIRKLDAMHRNEPSAQVLTGVDGAMIDYMAEASVAGRLKIYGKYLTADEMQPMRDKFYRYRSQWLELAAELASQVEQGGNPHSAAAQDLCSRWRKVNVAVWGANPETHKKIRMAHQNEPDLLIGTGINKDMLAFLEQGITHLVAQAQTTNKENSDA